VGWESRRGKRVREAEAKGRAHGPVEVGLDTIDGQNRLAREPFVDPIGDRSQKSAERFAVLWVIERLAKGRAIETRDDDLA